MSDHWLIPILRDLQDRKFFGEMTLKFRNGQIVLIEERKTILPPDSQEKNSEEIVHATRNFR